MTEELKPCPFCGGKADIHIYDDGPEYVYCTECFVSTAAHDDADGSEKAWNTRAGWQPIATAPKDGSPVSLHGYNRACPKWKTEAHDVFWTELNGFAGWHRRGVFDVPFPLEAHWVWTEWHHLPQPPEA